ncbi:hypothetical protein NX722_02285 [Endozoicomonas gorgoniicola]|uniref:Uncharacterized protein n=1 Tax=Endozoicomonas gorgoniicola TaxID=1234144 RepID=A0ABT3MQV3_9GAMM|nr:hypothetical protein [Endozoicomonas gorgoniicola]MCW7551488.1 hypothetical protein [Endozoicomonas gorgoniicola]
MKALNFILLKVLFFLLAITVLNSQAQNKFIFTNHIDARKTKVTVEEISPDGRDLLRVETLTSPDNGGGTISLMKQADVNPDGFWSLSDVGHKRESLKFSVLTRRLLVEQSQTGRDGSLHVLLPFIYLYDQTVSVRAELSYVTINNVPNNQDGSAFTLEGNLNVVRQIEPAVRTSPRATVEVEFNPDNDQLTRFVIRTAEGEDVNFTGELLLSTSSEQGADGQGADGQDEQSVVNDPETTGGDPNEGETERTQPVASDSESKATDVDQDEKGTEDKQLVASDSESKAADVDQDERGTEDKQPVASDSEHEAADDDQDEKGTEDKQPVSSDSEHETTDDNQDERGTEDKQPPVSSDSEQVTGDNQDEDGVTDNQPDDSRTLPINIPRVDQNHADGLPIRTPADQLDSRAGVLGSVSPGAEGVGHTKVE